MASILIAVWGNMFQWGEAVYRVSCSSQAIDNKVREIKSRSSTKALGDCINPDKIIIIAPDSVIAASGQGCTPKDTSNYVQRAKASKKYSEFKQLSSKVIESWLRECEVLEHVDVEVVPNVGWYGADHWLHLNIPATGTPFDQAGFFMLYYILKHLNSIEDESVNIHLDLTHGLNYLTTLLRDLGPFTAACHAMAKGVDMRLHVYNSEPYPSPRPSSIQGSPYIRLASSL
ncbi:CRISPR-associated protein [Aeropyrum pernix]|uniref:CRISPR-associated protein n=1 Tax=Aeropyrum pernix TaxID=56636 RepID=A0A401HAE4_AERPX|nr:TM1812 family CRISPR-associated protein [Aeropyrum pernix]GBF09328.1 CRISPR-associated protein [Aeropyrum pernix]